MYQQTSREAYYSIERINDKQNAVLKAIQVLQPCNDRMISELLQWPINRVTGRRNELVAFGLVEEHAKKTDEITHRTVIYWKVKEQQLKLF